MPEPVENVVERQIGGKTFKLGRLLSREEQDQVAAVISRHLDAFAWSASDMPDIDPNFFIPSSHHGPQGLTYATVEEEVKRGKAPRRVGRDQKAVERWPHQGDSVP